MKPSRLVRAAAEVTLLACFCCGGESPTAQGPVTPTLAEYLPAALESTLSAYGGTGVSAAVPTPGAPSWTGASGVSYGVHRHQPGDGLRRQQHHQELHRRAGARPGRRRAGHGQLWASVFGARAVGHAGSGLGYSGVLAYFPDYQTSIAVLMNDNNLDCLFATVSALMGKVHDHLS